MMRPVLAGAAMAFAFGAREAPGARTAATSILVVSVREAGTGASIQDADVRIPVLGRSARTKSDGETRFAGLTAGRYRIEVRAVGFAPRDVDAEVTGDTVSVQFELERVKTELDTIRVVVAAKASLRMAAFETRRKAGLGRFLTESQLAEDGSQSMQALLSTRFPGITVKEKGIVSMQPSGLAGDNECPVLIYLDGMQMEKVSRNPVKQVLPGRGGAGRSGRSAGNDPDDRRIPDLETLRPDEFAGVEVYSRTSAPQQYRPLGNYCKVVLLWTKL